MSNVEYDLDTSGGLMEQIQKLVAPPMSEEAQKRQRIRDRQHRRHQGSGRAVNHDYCNSCKEGGDLICCDRCPAAFHLQCHDPPLEEDDLPQGEWTCHRCRVTPHVEPEDDAESTCSSTSKHSNSTGGGSGVGSGRRIRTPIEPMILLDEEDEGQSKNPLSMLARAAKLMNPKQYELPQDVVCPYQLPGTSKRRWPYREPRGGAKKMAHELDNGMVPLPAKLCFSCSKSCRVGPLVQCDYCTLLFHLDCLNPPLASLPTGRWMCPNHPEHLVDSKLLTTVRLSERIKLYDKYTGPLNQHTVKVQFLNKIHRQHPPFRYKVRHQREFKLRVPSAIKEFYEHRQPLMQRLSDAQQVAALDGIELPVQSEASPEEQEEWLSSVVSLQTSIARHLAQKQLGVTDMNDVTVKSEPSSPPPTTGGKPTASVQPTLKQDQVASPDASGSESDKNLYNGGFSSPTQEKLPNGGNLKSPSSSVSLLTQSNLPNGDLKLVDSLKGKTDNLPVVAPRLKDSSAPAQNVLRLTVPPCSLNMQGHSKNKVVTTVNKSGLSSSSGVPTTATKVLGGAASSVIGSTPATNSTSILSPRPVGSAAKVTVVTGATALSGSKVITVSTPIQGKSSTSCSSSSGNISTKTITPATLSSSPAIINLNNTLQAAIEGSEDVELCKLDQKLVEILAWQRLQQLLPGKNSITAQVKRTPSNGLVPQTGGSSEVRARALLCPLTGKGQPVPMPYRTLNIGTGADMDVCLHSFGNCGYVSAKHACIFYDENTRHYELLNYSEHGTTVDNVLYSCDFSEKAPAVPPPANVVSSVRKLIGKTKNKEMKKEPEVSPPRLHKPTMSGHAAEARRPCACKASSSSLIGGSGAGWEGTALLHHGSYIKVGCVQFVFSIVEQATRDPLSDRKPAGTSLLKATLKSPSCAS